MLATLVAVVVEGTSACPTPAAVEQSLRPLLPEGGRDVVRLEAQDGTLQVTLVRADGSNAGRRTLGGEHTCQELAEAVAVMIAAWQSDLAGERALAPPPVAVVATPPPPVIPRPRPSWEVGAGLGGTLSGAAVAPALLLLGDVSLLGPLGAGARIGLDGNRNAALPGGSARWRRATLAVGPRVRYGERLAAEAHLGPALGWLHIAAQGFDAPQGHDAVVGGLEGELRLSWRQRGLRPWLALGAAFWPARIVVYQLPDRTEKALPRLQGAATLGLSFGR
jgi:hypothetical protein